MKRFYFLGIIGVVLALVGCKNSEPGQPVEGCIFRTDTEDKDGSYINYYTFNSDGTFAQDTYRSTEMNIPREQRTYYRYYTPTGTYTRDNGDNHYIIHLNSNRIKFYATYHSSGTYNYTLHFQKGVNWQEEEARKVKEIPWGYGIGFYDDSDVEPGGGDPDDPDEGKTTPTEEWVKVDASGYLPYWYCPTDGTTVPSTPRATSDINAYKNTSTGAYKVTWAGTEYAAHYGYNKLTLDTEYHSVYDSRIDNWTSCLDYYYFEFTIY